MQLATLAITCALIGACGDGSTAGEPRSAATQDASLSRQGQTTSKDRGEFAMRLDDATWTARSASARIKDGTLKISASRVDGSRETSMVRQAVDLYIAGFDGPGTYPLATMSRFSVVGLKTGGAAPADIDPEIADVLARASMVNLQGAEVVIVRASGGEVAGSFSPGELRSMSGEPVAITEGAFRAIVKE